MLTTMLKMSLSHFDLTYFYDNDVVHLIIQLKCTVLGMVF